MVPMLRRSLLPLCVLVAVFGLVLSSLVVGAQQNNSQRGRKFKMPPPTGRVEITVLRDGSGKPIANAAVIFHMVGDKGNMELKSNEDGKSVIDVLPIGSLVRLQIIARGFQTYGDDFKVDKDQIAIEVRMKRPGEQYSIYNARPEKKETKRDGRFIAYDDGTVLDTKTNLIWSAQDNGEYVSTRGAQTYLNIFDGGGYTDWRTPTQDEMSALFDPSQSHLGGNSGSKPLHVATELIKTDDECYHANLAHGSGSIGILEIPIFCFGDGKGTTAIGQRFKVLPVRSATPTAQSHRAGDGKP